jgi:uncharacterized protein YndB with AHSA1/START domain
VIIRAEVTIDRPREYVFHRLADKLGTTVPLICPLTTSLTLDSDKALTVGATGQLTVRNFVSRVVQFTVTGYQEPDRLSLEMRYRTRSSKTEYLFRDAGAGTTVALVTEAPPVGPQWLQGWNQWALERHERQDAQRLKALLEGRLEAHVKARRRSIVVFALIAAAIAALIGVALAVFQELTS